MESRDRRRNKAVKFGLISAAIYRDLNCVLTDAAADATEDQL